MLAEPYEKQKKHFEDAWKESAKARPFISDIGWALFSAYQAILMFAVFRLTILKVGVNIPGVIDTDAVVNLVKVALPHQAAYVTEKGANSFHYLLDELENRLLEEIRKMLQGVESDKATVAQAATILKESESIMKTIMQPPPPDLPTAEKIKSS